MASHVKKKTTDKPWFEIKFGEEVGRNPDEVSVAEFNTWASENTAPEGDP